MSNKNIKKSNADLAERVAFFRAKAGLSCSELSGRIDKSTNYINRFEYLKFNIPAYVIYDICEACDVTVEEFFSNDYKHYEDNQQLASTINKMPFEMRKQLLTFVDMVNKK